MGGNELGYFAQGRVAGQVAITVIVFLEEIDIEHGQRQRLAGAGRAPPFGFQRQVETAAVAHARQAVGGAQRGQLAVRLFQFGGARRHQLFQLGLVTRQALDAPAVRAP